MFLCLFSSSHTHVPNLGYILLAEVSANSGFILCMWCGTEMCMCGWYDRKCPNFVHSGHDWKEVLFPHTNELANRCFPLVGINILETSLLLLVSLLSSSSSVSLFL